MSKKITWDELGEKLFETGCDRGVLYPYDAQSKKYKSGVAWCGLTAVNESPSGAEETAIYADNIKYASLYSNEEFAATIEAYMYPDEWAECDGSAALDDGIYAGQQKRTSFGLAYRTLVGNDTELEDYGYKLHLIYGCKASPSEKSYATVSDSPEAITLSWEAASTPVAIATLVDGKKLKPTSVVTIDSKKVSAAFLKKLEDTLYGTDTTEPTLPSPDEIIEMANSVTA